jgi:hypothetical protein
MELMVDSTIPSLGLSTFGADMLIDVWSLKEDVYWIEEMEWFGVNVVCLMS